MKTSHFFIGPGRTGTTYLYDLVRQTPGVLAPKIKEPAFFDSRFDKGFDWYDGLYAKPAKNTRYRVDFSNLYYLNESAIQRAYSYNPNAKFIMIRRNRSDLFRSILYFELRKGKSLQEVKCRSDHVLYETDYDYHIPKIRKIVRNNLIIIDFSLIVQHNVNEISRLCQLPIRTYAVRLNQNAAVIPKFKLLAFFAKKTALMLRNLELFRLLQFLKNNKFLKSLLFTEESSSSAINARLKAEVELMIAKIFGDL